jgi:hypothetical protein
MSDGLRELADLLMSLFTVDELRRFVRLLPDGRSLAYELPSGPVSLSHLAFDVTLALERHGLHPEFFERLLEERPGRRDEIEKVRAMVQQEAPHQAIVEGPSARAPGSGPSTTGARVAGETTISTAEPGYDFFLVYASPDRKQAEYLYDLLIRQPDVRVFLDSRSLTPGASWLHELDDAISRSRIAVVLLSRRMNESWLADFESRHAIELHHEGALRLVPVYLDGWMKDVPSYLGLLHGLNARDLGLEGVATSLLRMRRSSPDSRFDDKAPDSSAIKTSMPVHERLLPLAREDEDRLVLLLEENIAMVDNATRRMVLEQLEPDIQQRIAHHSVLRVHLTNIVQVCAAYPGGIEQLVEAIRRVEGESPVMKRIDEFLRRFQ